MDVNVEQGEKSATTVSAEVTSMAMASAALVEIEGGSIHPSCSCIPQPQAEAKKPRGTEHDAQSERSGLRAPRVALPSPPWKLTYLAVRMPGGVRHVYTTMIRAKEQHASQTDHKKTRETIRHTLIFAQVTRGCDSRRIDDARLGERDRKSKHEQTDPQSGLGRTRASRQPADTQFSSVALLPQPPSPADLCFV
jgi:hypothetical protein